MKFKSIALGNSGSIAVFQRHCGCIVVVDGMVGPSAPALWLPPLYIHRVGRTYQQATNNCAKAPALLLLKPADSYHGITLFGGEFG